MADLVNDCQVCGAWPLNQCHALDGHPLAVPHAERTESTPIHDALLTATASSPISLPSRTRADAGAPTATPTEAQPRPSTRALTPSAGQGHLVGAAR